MGKQLKGGRDPIGQLYEGSDLPGDVIQEVIDYGNVEPLCRLIEEGDALLWGDQRARSLIAQIVRNGGGLHRGSGKRTDRTTTRRNDWVLSRLCYWKGFGLAIHGAKPEDPQYTNACMVVANELQDNQYGWDEINEDSVVRLWKKHKPAPGVRALQEAYGKMLADAARGDAALRRKIELKYRFDVDRVLGSIK